MEEEPWQGRIDWQAKACDHRGGSPAENKKRHSSMRSIKLARQNCLPTALPPPPPYSRSRRRWQRRAPLPGSCAAPRSIPAAEGGGAIIQL